MNVKMQHNARFENTSLLQNYFFLVKLQMLTEYFFSVMLIALVFKDLCQVKTVRVTENLIGRATDTFQSLLTTLQCLCYNVS